MKARPPARPPARVSDIQRARLRRLLSQLERKATPTPFYPLQPIDLRIAQQLAWSIAYQQGIA